MAQSGVRLILVRGTRIRPEIRIQDKNVEYWNDEINGKPVRILTIKKADACFLNGGSVGVRMPGSSSYWISFNPMTVLQIRNYSGKRVLVINRYLCTNCFANTCGIVFSNPLQNGLVEAVMRCVSCSEEFDRTF